MPPPFPAAFTAIAAAEPLDASTSILLVYFEPRDKASSEPCVLQTYEVFVEQRGEGLYKVRSTCSLHRPLRLAAATQSCLRSPSMAQHCTRPRLLACVPTHLPSASPFPGLQIAVEGGPKLQAREAGGRFHRVRDLVLENLALHTVGAWLLYDDAAGRRSVDCVALAFQSGPPDTGQRW